MLATRSQAARIDRRVPGSLIALTIVPVLAGGTRVAQAQYLGAHENGSSTNADRPRAPALQAINVTTHSIIAYAIGMERGLGTQLRHLLELLDGAVAESYARESLRYPLIALSALCALGFRLLQVPNNRNFFVAAPPDWSGAAGGMQGTARLRGQTAGAVLMTALFNMTPLTLAPRIRLEIEALPALSSGLVSLLGSPGRGGQIHACH